MSPLSTEQDPHMRQVVDFLEAAPPVQVPDGFAARLAAQLPEPSRMPLMRVPAAVRGVRLLHLSAALLLLLAFAAAALASRGHAVWLVVEWAAAAQMFALIFTAGILRRTLQR